MRPLFVPARRAPARATEASVEQLVATGAVGGYGVDPVDGDRGWRPAGTTGREVPWWTGEKARIYGVNAYRANPMAKAIVDTYTSFCVGDSGVTTQVTNPQVQQVVDEFWTDPRNALGDNQELLLRSHLIMGETLWELMVGQVSGVVRYSPIDPGRIQEVTLYRGNPMWPYEVTIENREQPFRVAAINDETGLREGDCIYWPSFKAVDTDTRGVSFLMSISDQLDSYDTVLSNLIDRTALARYFVWDVTVEGGQAEVNEFIAARKGTHVPPSGSLEVHNDNVKFEPKYVQTGAEEDSVAARSVLTQVAAGAGLAKTWLAEPEDANRATSLTMAEPVRRRVGGVQNMWLGRMAEFIRYAVDRAVAAGRLPRTVESRDPRTGQTFEVPASRTVMVTGPKIAAADAQIQAQVLLNLSTGLQKLVEIGALSREGARIAARRAWEDYVGVPYTAELDKPDADPDDIATAIEDATEAIRKAGGKGNAATLKRYWTKGKGLGLWADKPKPWTALEHHLAKYMPPGEAKRTATEWFIEVFGYAPGSDLNRVAHGKPPRGNKVGPG